MAGKFFTVQVNDEKLVSSQSSKQSKVVVKDSQKEVEVFGIVEINNNSAKAKVKNKKDIGFEKNVVSCQKKSIKSNLEKVDDYFDFTFKIDSSKNATKKSASKIDAQVAVVESENVSKVVKSDFSEDRHITVEAKACDRFIYDEEVKKVISVAREGALFG